MVAERVEISAGSEGLEVPRATEATTSTSLGFELIEVEQFVLHLSAPVEADEGAGSWIAFSEDWESPDDSVFDNLAEDADLR
jgi:hypothetical protein